MALRFLNSGYFAGNVGIGTDSPGAKLDIDGDVLIKSGEFISWGTVGSTSIEGSTVSNKLQFRTNNSDRMIINSSGNVGIGTTTPNAKLDIQGTQGQLFSVTDDLSGEIFAVSDISGVPIMTVNSSGVSYFDGNVGIGTTTPNANLDIEDASGVTIDINSSSGDGQFRFQDDGVTKWSVGRDNTQQNFVFSSSTGLSSDNVLTLAHSTGNVGIGTDSPDSQLEVYKLHATEGASLMLTSKDAGIGSPPFSEIQFKTSRTDSTSLLQAGRVISGWDGNSYASSRITLQNANGVDTWINTLTAKNGNVGIGTTSPLKKLSINGGDVAVNNGNSFIVGAAITGNSQIGELGADSGQLQLLTESTRDIKFGSTTYGNIMFLEGTNGNVGIGTDSPGSKFEVYGGNSGVNDVDRYARFKASNGEKRFDFYMGGTGNSSRLDMYSFDGTSKNIQIASGGISYLNGGNVGINTTSPDFKLDVDGTLGVSDLPFNTDSVSVLVADETLGVDLVTNGDFATNTDWSLDTGVTISGGTMNFTSVSGQYGSQNVGFTNGAEYILTFEITAETSGTLTVFLGAGNNVGAISGVGKKQIFATADSTLDTKLYFGSNFTGSIDNVVLKQVTSTSNQIQKRELGTGAFGPTPVGAYLPLAGGTMTGNTNHNDSVYSKYGTANQLRIWNNGSNSYIFNYTSGNINIGNDAVDKDVIFYADRGDGLEDVFFRLDGSETNGTSVLGVTLFPDKSQARFGNQGDLRIYHDGSNSYITDSGTGDLIITADNDLTFKDGSGNIMANMNASNSVELMFGNVKKFETKSTGIAVVGDIKIDSALLSNQENTDIDTGAEVVAQVAHATYTAAFFDFVVKKGTNVRSGTVYACHNGDTTPLVEFTETSTNDLGDTSDVTLSVDISGANMRLLATVTSDDWSVKSLIKAI